MDDEDDNTCQQNLSQGLRSPSNTISSTTATGSQLLTNRYTNTPRNSHPIPTMRQSPLRYSTVSGDDDELQPTSSTPSSAVIPPIPNTQSSDTLHHLSSSLLASPDSTFATHSSSSNSHNRSRGEISSFLQDSCVVSSSTSDEVPVSFFVRDNSPEHYLLQASQRHSPIPSPLAHVDPNGKGTSSNSSEMALVTGNVSKPNRGMNGYSSISDKAPNATSEAPFPLTTSYVSPLRNEFKKASTFERFSAKAQASTNNQVNSNLSNTQDANSSIIIANTTAITTATSLPPRSAVSCDKGGSHCAKSNVSVYDTIAGTKPFLIKKLVARLANVAELERLEAKAVSALATESDAETTRLAHNYPAGCDTVDGVGHGSVPQPQPSTSNTQVANTVVNSPMRRQLTQSSLNVPECSTNSMVTIPNSGCESDTTGNTVAWKNFTGRKIPLTPKQKLLHRMQSGEITIPPSKTPPPPTLQQPFREPILSLGTTSCVHSAPINTEPHQAQNSILMSFQPQHNLMHNQFGGTDENQAISTGSGMTADAASSPGDRYSNVINYEAAFIRSAAGDSFVESIPKPIGDETNENGNTNNQIIYDTGDSYNYYYGNLLSEDEIFVNNNCGNGSLVPISLPICASLQSTGPRIGHSNNLHNSVTQDAIQFQQSATHSSNCHLELMLGFPGGVERIYRDGVQLDSSEELQLQQQQYLDSNELSFAGSKSAQIAEISTLRNLLMMEPLTRSQHEEPWISVPAAEYRNRLSSSNTMRIGGNGSPLITASTSSAGSMGLSNSWVGEWSSRTWQPPPGQSRDEEDKDEVMDMSVIEIDKTHSNSQTLIKRISHLHPHTSTSSQHGMVMEEVDLANGLPLLTSMPLPLDLQSTFENHMTLGKNQIITDPSVLIMSPQHHQQRSVILEYDEEPVNLMSAGSIEQGHIHQSQASRESGYVNISLPHSQSGHTLEGGEPIYENVCMGSNIHIFTTTSTTSTAVNSAIDATQVQSESPRPQPQKQTMEFQSGLEENIDEKRLIRVKKKRENLESSDFPETIDKKPNFIPDKPVQPKSFASLPSLLTLTRMSGNGWGVVTNRNKKIPINARFGPVEGPLKRASVADIENNETVYPVLVMVDRGGIVYQLDRTDDDLCNWMKFVRRARSGQEQNILVSEEDGLLYFTSCREIPPKSELQVGYGYEYAEKYNLPNFAVESIEVVKEPPVTRKCGGTSRKLKLKVEPLLEEKFVCFECDLNCVSTEELKKHLDSAHTEEINGGCRRRLKKTIRKVCQDGRGGADRSIDVKELLTGGPEARVASKRSAKEKEVEQLQKKQPEAPSVESSSPGILPNKNEEKEPPGRQRRTASISSSSTTVMTKIKCSICYKAFATQHRLQKHMNVHNDDSFKPLKCEICSKRFLTNSALAGHLKSHEDLQFQCPLCEFYTEQLLLLKEHVQSHQNKESGSFSCPHCPKDFKCYSLVRKHVRAFHGPRLYSCGDCYMKFPTPDKLKLHELRHSSFRAYLCAECGRQFKRKDKLTDHTRKAHDRLQNDTPVPTTTEDIPISHYLLTEKHIPFEKKVFGKKVFPRNTEEQLTHYTFRCQDCMIGFRRRGMLVNHLAKRHPEINPDRVPELALPITRTAKNYFCPHCERVYKSSSKRKSHILKNHPGKPIPPQVRGKDIKAIVDEKVGSTTVDFNLNDFESGSMENLNNLSVDEAIRKEAVVGEITGTPHACTWCYRQYATRAKLLQHQRKFHIELMPPEIQTPRPQKNNVKHSLESLDSFEPGNSAESTDLQSNSQQEDTTSMTIDCEKQTLGPHQSQDNMFGYLITTSGHVTNNELETLLQPEFMLNLLAQQNSVGSTAESSSCNITGTRTITLCIPPGMISANSHSVSTGNHSHTAQVISSGINVNGTQIQTKTD